MSVEISEVPIESEPSQVSSSQRGIEDTSKNDNLDNLDNDNVSSQSVLEDKQIQENNEINETNENNDPIINHENKKDDETPPNDDESKKKRGRPKGSINKPKSKAKAKATESRAKAKKLEVRDDVISDSDTLPAYVQQSPDYTMPQPQDLASQLFGLLQRHEHERTNRRRATYASWMTRF